MDLSEFVSGIRLHDRDVVSSNSVVENRKRNIQALLSWTAESGLSSRGVKVVVHENGKVSLIAERFIQKDVEIVILPLSVEISFSDLKTELFPERWSGLSTLVQSANAFEAAFKWTEKSSMKKECFSRILTFVACIYAAHRKLSLRPAGSPETNPLLKTFDLYWKAMQPCTSDVLSWTDEELEYLKPTTVYKGLADSRRFGTEVFETVLKPFLLRHKEYFGDCVVSVNEFLRLSATISSRSYVSEEKGNQLLPVVDMFNGKPDQYHNCILDGNFAHGKFVRTIKTSAPVCAGDELFLEFANASNGSFLMSKHYVPLDRRVILNNCSTEISFNMIKYFDMMLKKIHPTNAHLREAKKTYIYSITGVPKTLVISMDILKRHGLQCLRQVLIFLQCDEKSMRRTIQTQRLKYKVNAFLLFQSFLLLVESQMGKPQLETFQQLVSHPERLTENMRSALFLQMSERIVVEHFMNEFIDLFDELQYPTALSILGPHMIEEEISGILSEMEKPQLVRRSKVCMICGSMERVVRCSRCHVAFYCGSSCQQFHWKAGHKRECKKELSMETLAIASAPLYPINLLGTTPGLTTSSQSLPPVPSTTAEADNNSIPPQRVGASSLDPQLPKPPCKADEAGVGAGGSGSGTGGQIGGGKCSSDT